MSPAQRHRARVLASLGSVAIASHGLTPGMVGAAGFAPANDGAQEPGYSGAQAQAYQLHMAQVVTDLARLKQVQSLERKIDLKRELLPEYAPWIEGVLAAERGTGVGVQDDVLVHVMIWRLDVRDFAGAMPLVDYLLRHHLRLPARFERTPATLCAELIADGALEELKAGRPGPLPELGRMVELADHHDMPDQVKARLHKALGLELARQAEDPRADVARMAGGARGFLSAALTHLQRALDLDPRCGAKADAKRVERALAASAEGGE